MAGVMAYEQFRRGIGIEKIIINEMVAWPYGSSKWRRKQRQTKISK
jgi:hypothetical protein